MKRLIVVFGVVLGACRDAHPEIVHPSPAVAAHYLGTAAMAAQAAKAVRPIGVSICSGVQGCDPRGSARGRA